MFRPHIFFLSPFRIAHLACINFHTKTPPSQKGEGIPCSLKAKDCVVHASLPSPPGSPFAPVETAEVPSVGTNRLGDRGIGFANGFLLILAKKKKEPMALANFRDIYAR